MVGEKGSSIIVGSGESFAAVKAGSIKGLVCDREGNELFPALEAVVPEVAVMPLALIID
jgi:hypothetical protein